MEQAIAIGTDPRFAKLQEAIEKGKSSVKAGLESIEKEFQVRKDLFVKPSAIDYEVSGGAIRPVIQEQPYSLTEHSQGQMFARVGVPAQFAEKLMDYEEDDLLRLNLLRMTERSMDDGAMLRTVGEQIKGWLSPAFKRMDAAPVIGGFIERSLKNGMVPYRGMNTDYRYQIAMIWPKVFQPVPNEFVAFGTNLTTGDYGNQALEIDFMALRITCLNLAVGMDLFRKVHLGSRFATDKEAIEFSKKTLLLDAKAISSAVGDVVDHAQGEVARVEKAIDSAHNTVVDKPEKWYETLKRKGMRKAVVDQVKSVYESRLPFETLPQENSIWRLSNAISLVAGGMEGDQKINVEKMAFDVLGLEGGA